MNSKVEIEYKFIISKKNDINMILSTSNFSDYIIKFESKKFFFDFFYDTINKDLLK